jgi:hypothetical protein
MIERNCKKKKIRKKEEGGAGVFEREMRGSFDIRVLIQNLCGLGPNKFSNIKANFLYINQYIYFFIYQIKINFCYFVFVTRIDLKYLS